MAKLYNLARVFTSTAGTGTITLGSAVSGFLTFSGAGVADGDVVTYAISDGTNSEIGRGTYAASGTTLTRSVIRSTNSNTAISLSGNAQVFITAAAEDFGWDNYRTAKTGNYTVTNADKNSTLGLGGNLYNIITFSAISGGNYDANFQVTLINEDSGHAKYITLNGAGSAASFILYPGQTVTVFANNSTWQVIGQSRWRLTGNTTFFVDGSSGSDTANAADGLSNASGARASIQGALNDILNNVDLGGFTVTVSIAAGTYTGAVTLVSGFVGNGAVKLSGDTTTPANVLLSVTANSCITLGSASAPGNNPPALQVEGIKFATTTSGNCIQVSDGAYLCITNKVEFGLSAGVHMQAQRAGRIQIGATAYNVSGNATRHANMVNNGQVNWGGGVTVTASNTPKMTAFFIGMNRASSCAVNNTAFGAGWDGTTIQWSLDTCAVLDTGGATIPGTSVGNVKTNNAVQI
jgi:hypothetical protein